MASASGWTLETLKEHVDARFHASEEAVAAALIAQKEAVAAALAASDRAVAAAMTAQKEAVDKAEIASEKRLSSLNEFRATLQDVQGTLMPRAEANVLFKANDERLAALQATYSARLDTLRLAFEKETDGLEREVAGLRESRSAAGGQSTATREVIAWVFAAGGLALAVLSFVLTHK